MNSIKLLIFLMFGLLITSCSNNSTSDLIAPAPVAGTVKFSQNIKSITDGNCIVCHASVPVNGAPMSLDTYANVKQAVLNRGLIGRISRQEGDGLLMPQGGPKLPQNQIDLIIQWQNDGFQE